MSLVKQVVWKEIGKVIAEDRRIPFVSVTGGTKVGQIVQNLVNARFVKCLLELSGNNALIIMEDADLAMVVRPVLFAAVGTAGQRCTSCRRLLLHEKIYKRVIPLVKRKFASKLMNCKFRKSITNLRLFGTNTGYPMMLMADFLCFIYKISSQPKFPKSHDGIDRLCIGNRLVAEYSKGRGLDSLL